MEDRLDRRRIGVQKIKQPIRRNELGDGMLGEVAPFIVMTKPVGDHHVARARAFTKRRDKVRADKSGAPRDHDHSILRPDTRT